MPLYLGIDLGGTKVAVGIVDDEGTVSGRVREATAAAREGPGILASLERLGRQAARLAGVDFASVSAAGIGLPGPTDHRWAMMLAAPTIPELEGVPLAERLAERLGMPLSGDNDANAAALAEARFGAGRGASLVVYITISTGIGGGIVVDRRLLRGAARAAGEFGHQVMERDGEPCDCGGSGCLETIASGPSIARRARRMLPHYPGSLLARADWRDSRPWDARLVAAAAREEDPLAAHLWDEVGEFLGVAVASAINLLDPDCVVLGGGVMGAADLLLPAVRQAAAEHAMPRLQRQLRIVPAALAEDVGIVGAAALAMEVGEDGDRPSV